MKAARINEFGPADNFFIDEIDQPQPATGEVLIKQDHAGLNFIDVYMRNGLYPIDQFPATLGMEAAGTVVDAGDSTKFKVGDRVAYVMIPGAYAEYRCVHQDKLVKLPDSISTETAATMMLKGLTAYYLLRRTYVVKPGDSLLVYGAAGGVGTLLTQWGKHLGATVIGCVGDENKAEIARDNGCDATILYRSENIPQRVKELTHGKGVNVAYDGIGQSTFNDSLDSLGNFGMLVSYGNITGKVEPFSPAILAPKGSLYVTRPTLATHVSTPELLNEAADGLFKVIDNNIVTTTISHRWPLAEIAEAHKALENRQTSGLTVIDI